VCKLLGTPTDAQWPVRFDVNLFIVECCLSLNEQEMKKLPDYGKISFDDFDGMKLEDIVPEACAHALNLLRKFLVYPSKQRIGAQQVRKTIH
jgi:hypothetical protein